MDKSKEDETKILPSIENFSSEIAFLCPLKLTG